MTNLLQLVGVLFVALCVSAQTIPDQDWGYVDVRPQAHMFWWLYGKLDATTRSSAPLIMWLQGGPGASSTGYGNFQELGPLDVNLKPRNSTWATVANLIFVDNPVGSGYSYVDATSAYVTTEDQIAADLLTLFKAFLVKYPIFQKNPFFIFCESYGGKMASSFAAALLKASKEAQITVNFRAVALGDSWIDPLQFLDAWIPYLEWTTEIDETKVAPIWAAINQTHVAMANKQYSHATDLWGQIEGMVGRASFGVNWYNILDRNPNDNMAVGMKSYLSKTAADPLSTLMNGPIKQKLGIPAKVTWGGQSNAVFSYLSDDFMQSVVPTVDQLLAANFPVIVYSGNLDLICCTPGTLAWINELKWPLLSSWHGKALSSFSVGGQVAGTYKIYQNLHFYEIYASGHMVPTDQPEAALWMVKQVLAL